MKKPVGVLVLLVILGALWYVLEPQSDGSYQGYIEGDYVYGAAEEGGRLTVVSVADGDSVTAGEVLFILDGTVQAEMRRQAEAALQQAEAQLRDVTSAARRPEEVAVLQAQEERARAQMELSRSNFERQSTLKEKGFTSQAMYDQALAALDRDRAALAEIQKQITVGELSGRSETVRAAEAAVDVARAALRQVDARIDKLTVRAPGDALVYQVYYHVGEVVTAGQPVVSLLPPLNRKIRFYVPEPDVAKLTLGMTVRITCDSCPPDLTARVSYIADSVEYTPPVIFSEKERHKLVFRVEARPEGMEALPVGLPVSVFAGSAEEQK